MNKQFPTTEALDEQERELARVLRALPGGEPPAALDARILKAAGNAAAASRRPRTRWIASAGALWGIGGAAAAVLALGVSWQLMYPENPSMRPEAAPAARMEDKAEDSTVSVELKDQQSSVPGNAPAPSPALNSAMQESAAQAYSAAPAAPLPAPTTAALPEPFASEHLDEHVTTSADVGAGAESDSPSAAIAGRSEALSNAAPAAKAAAESRMAQRAAASDAAATGGLAMAPEPGPMKPANWFAHIRQLQAQDRTAEAKASLIEFQKRYPNFVIPSDLAPLLRE
jgi:hypothetical protein